MQLFVFVFSVGTSTTAGANHPAQGNHQRVVNLVYLKSLCWLQLFLCQTWPANINIEPIKLAFILTQNVKF